jgi:CRISPR-associated protein Cas1
MANLYLTEQNSILRKTGDRLIVQKEDAILLDVQCHKIDAVLIFGNVQFTTQVVHELFEHGIEMAILTRTGRLIGQITSPSPKNVFLRMAQFKKYEDAAFRLAFARAVVSGKLRNSAGMVRRFAYNHPDIDLNAELSQLDAAVRAVETAASPDQLNGIEGNAARAYFAAFGKMMLGEFSFAGRKKRPAPDPVNAMLSLSYTMLYNEIASLLDGIGFDPYLGYYHEADYGRASLAADLMEEFRAPVGDRLVLYLANMRIFKPEDFYANPKGGMYFIGEAMKRYFVEYEKMINQEFTHPETGEKATLRKAFRFQAEKMARVLQNDEPYVPFRFEE